MGRAGALAAGGDPVAAAGIARLGGVSAGARLRTWLGVAVILLGAFVWFLSIAVANTGN